MKINDWLTSAQNKLANSGINTSRLDALVLLSDELGKDKSWLLANPNFKLVNSQIRTLETQLERRAKHEPLAYIRGKSEFFGREFKVNKHTLEPRPETETMIEILLKHSPAKVVDIGTGSGCIAVTAKLEMPQSDVLAADISDECLKIAKKNASRLDANIKVIKSDLLSSVSRNFIEGTAICCNLPYVPDSFTVNQAALQEPRLAIFGGPDGLQYYRRLFMQLRLQKPMFVLTESLPPQHDQLAKIAEEYGFRLVETSDFIQRFQTN